MANHVGVWWRIGVVASVLWFVGCFAYGYIDEVQRLNIIVSDLMKMCLADGTKTFDSCWADTARWRSTQPTWVTLGEIAVVVALPLPVMWTLGLLVWIMYRLGRWIRAGFAPINNSMR